MEPVKNQPAPEASLHFLDYWRIIRIRKTVIIAVFLLVVITATVVTFILPESFVGTARVNVQHEGSDIPSMANGNSIGAFGVDPYFIQTELEIMQSQKLLKEVVEKLNLNEKWGTKFHGGERLTTPEAIAYLKGQMRLDPSRGTSLIEIKAYSDNPAEAADLANTIAEAYRDYRLERSRGKTEQGIKALEQELVKQQKELSDAQAEVDRLRKELNVQDF